MAAQFTSNQERLAKFGSVPIAVDQHRTKRSFNLQNMKW
jgi:hypothetical protein